MSKTTPVNPPLGLIELAEILNDSEKFDQYEIITFDGVVERKHLGQLKKFCIDGISDKWFHYFITFEESDIFDKLNYWQQQRYRNLPYKTYFAFLSADDAFKFKLFSNGIPVKDVKIY